MLANIELVILSFTASLGFGIVFQIGKKDLIYAGLGGALTRIVYLILMAFIPYRIVYAAAAAFFAAGFSEFMASRKKMPATFFLYPTIVPLIPGDLLYYNMAGMVMQDRSAFEQYGIECILSLIGISLGFVICSSVGYFIRTHVHLRSNKNTLRENTTN